MESDSDYEEASEDPFEGQFSDSDDSSDDSNDEIEIDNRDCLVKIFEICGRRWNLISFSDKDYII